MRIIRTDNVLAPAGHYSQALEHEGFVYVSGQLPVQSDGTHCPDLAFEDQTRRALSNVLAIVKAAGGESGSLLRITAYIVGVENWPSFNGVYTRILGDAKPARTVVPVPELHYGYLVEIDAVAFIQPSHRPGNTMLSEDGK